jgi:hypothetical protein
VLEVVVGDADLGGHVAAQVGVDDVAHLDEVLEHRAAGRRREIEGQRPLVAVEGLEEEGVLALAVRRHVATDVSADARILDLDHFRSEIGQVHAAERAGAVLLDRDDADVGERLGVLAHRCAPVRSAIMARISS